MRICCLHYVPLIGIGAYQARDKVFHQNRFIYQNIAEIIHEGLVGSHAIFNTMSASFRISREKFP